MDKNFLLRVSDSFKQIRTQLLLNEKIRNYLYWDVIDENTVTPSIEMVKDYIYIQPIITVETTEPFNKKNYITITVPEGNKDNNKMQYVVRIIIMSEKSCWEVNDDIRPLIIAQEVVNVLDGFKTYFSNALVFKDIVETVTNKDVCGYSVLFSTVDGISDVDEK